MARLLVLDVTKAKTSDMLYEAEFNCLDDYYRHLQCDCFDIAHRKIGGKYYDIFCDDVGLFVDKPKVSAICESEMSPMLVGNLIFANHDDAGNTTSLSDEDIFRIKNNMLLVKFVNEEEARIVVSCEY